MSCSRAPENFPFRSQQWLLWFDLHADGFAPVCGAGHMAKSPSKPEALRAVGEAWGDGQHRKPPQRTAGLREEREALRRSRVVGLREGKELSS